MSVITRVTRSSLPRLRSAPTNPYSTTFSGKRVDLVHPDPEDVDFGDVAHHLAHICRYGGAAKLTYSVAQHCVAGLKHCSLAAKPFFLVHDGHEYVSQDDTSPKKRALPLVMADALADKFPLADLVKFKLAVETAFDQFELRHMRAVHIAAGLEWPVSDAIEREVKHIDRRMLLTEWRELMEGPLPDEYRWPGVEPFPEGIGMPWPFERAREEYLNQCRRLLPCFGNQVAA